MAPDPEYPKEDTDDGTGIVVSEKNYDDNGDLDWARDGRGNQTRFFYEDGYHRVTRQTTTYTSYPSHDSTGDPNTEATQSYAYSALGNVAKITDPNSHVTVVEYDGEGRERRSLKVRDTQSDYPNNGTVHGYAGFVFAQTEYDLGGRKVSETDGRGIVSEAVFDVLDRVKEERRSGTRTASYRYETSGNRLWWQDAEGNERDYAYDDYGYLDSETGYTETGNSSTAITVRDTLYDRQGNLLEEKDAGSPDPNVTTYSYDLRSRLATQTLITDDSPLTTAFNYDGAGNKTSETSPRGNATTTEDDFTTTWEYDEFGRLTTVTSPDAGETKYYYDPNGNLLRVEDAEYDSALAESRGHYSTFEYDQLGNRITATRHAGSDYPIASITDRFGCDSVGNMLWQKDGEDRVVAYTDYDEFDRLKAETRDLPADAVADLAYLKSITHAYDGNGNVDTTTETFETSTGTETTRTITRLWDNFDRLTSETADEKQVQWTYDNDGRRTSITYPGGRDLHYSYDGLGRLECASEDPACQGSKTDYTYYNNGLVEKIEHPNESTETWAYKLGTQEPTSLTITDGTLDQIQIRQATYEYDADGNRETERDTRDGHDTIYRENTYDASGRLETVQEGTSPSSITQKITYTYDKLGNRTNEQVENITDPVNPGAPGKAWSIL